MESYDNLFGYSENLSEQTIRLKQLAGIIK